MVTKEKLYSDVPPTKLRNKEEMGKYQFIIQNCDAECKKILPKLLRTGVLLSNNTDDKSTMLDNLFNICTQPRITGLNAQGILKETLKTIDNPYLITQKFGNIPNTIINDVVKQENNTVLQQAEAKQAKGEPITSGFIRKQDLDVISSCCVAASIEFIKYMLSDSVAIRILETTGQVTSNPNIDITQVEVSDRMEQAVDCVEAAGMILDTPQNLWNMSKKEAYGKALIQYLKGEISVEEFTQITSKM